MNLSYYMMLIYSKKVTNEGKQSWFLFTEFFFIGIQDKLKNFKFHKFTKTCKKLLHEKYVKNWYIKKSSFLDGKLTTYFKLKQNFGFERYLSYTKKK